MRLRSVTPSGRPRAAKGLGNYTITVRVALESPADFDEEVISLLESARAESL